MNYNNFSSPRDRIDERLLSRISNPGRCCQNGCTQTPPTPTSCGCNESRENQIEENECSFNYDNSDFDYSLAMLYSPYQEWQNIYCLEKGFAAGTIFKELDKTFYGPKCHGGDCYE